MKQYIQEFHSPWSKAWFDTRQRVALWLSAGLDSHPRQEHGQPDGDADWAEVRKALMETGYSGSAIAELKGGNEAYLRDLSRPMDRLVLVVRREGW